MTNWGFTVCMSSFFQAEDGIRDLTVTGVQTCALPISARTSTPAPRGPPSRWAREDHLEAGVFARAAPADREAGVGENPNEAVGVVLIGVIEDRKSVV